MLTCLCIISSDRAVAYGGLRDSIRITTNDAYGIGSLFVLDTLHTPYGVSTSSPLSLFLVITYISL